MQRRETTSITDGDSDAFSGRADRNAFAHARSNTEHNSIPNTDGAYADTITPVTRESKRAETSSQTHLAARFVSTLQLSNNSQFSRVTNVTRLLSVCLHLLRVIRFRALAASRIRKLSLKATFTRRFSKRTSAASLKQGSILRQGS